MGLKNGKSLLKVANAGVLAPVNLAATTVSNGVGAVVDPIKATLNTLFSTNFNVTGLWNRSATIAKTGREAILDVFSVIPGVRSEEWVKEAYGRNIRNIKKSVFTGGEPKYFDGDQQKEAA